MGGAGVMLNSPLEQDRDYDETVQLLRTVRERAGVDATELPERLRTVLARTGCMVTLQQALCAWRRPRLRSDACGDAQREAERQAERDRARAQALGHAVLLSLGPMDLPDFIWTVLSEDDRFLLDQLSRQVFSSSGVES